VKKRTEYPEYCWEECCGLKLFDGGYHCQPLNVDKDVLWLMNNKESFRGRIEVQLLILGIRDRKDRSSTIF